MSIPKLRAVTVEFARRIADRFRPEKIVLFGSHAYGTPTPDSDVDLLVVMPARNQISQAVKIRSEFPAPFPLDLIVRAPKRLKRRLAEGDTFLQAVMTRGIVLHSGNDDSFVPAACVSLSGSANSADSYCDRPHPEFQ